MDDALCTHLYCIWVIRIIKAKKVIRGIRVIRITMVIRVTTRDIRVMLGIWVINGIRGIKTTRAKGKTRLMIMTD